MLDIQLYTGPAENRLCSCINGNKRFGSIASSHPQYMLQNRFLTHRYSAYSAYQAGALDCFTLVEGVWVLTPEPRDWFISATGTRQIKAESLTQMASCFPYDHIWVRSTEVHYTAREPDCRSLQSEHPHSMFSSDEAFIYTWYLP